MGPRVFISSVIQGFDAFREAARRGVLTGGGEPVLVNEDVPSQPDSSRNVCLDLVHSSDAVVLLIGSQGGWVTPSGKTVVEEEVSEARRLGKPLLVFLQDVSEHDNAAARLAAEVSDYISGYYRRTFREPIELEEQVTVGVREITKTLALPKSSPSEVRKVLESAVKRSTDAIVRIVVAPVRHEEVIPPSRLEAPELLNTLYRLGHDPTIALFAYEYPKQARRSGDQLVVVQNPGYRDVPIGSDVEVTITERGMVTIDVSVTGSSGQRSWENSNTFEVATAALQNAIMKGMRFTGAVFADQDPYQRHHAFLVDIALVNLGYRTIQETLSPPSGSHQVRMHSGDRDVIIAWLDPRVIQRRDLTESADVAERAVIGLRRGAAGGF